jgi:hypothetical protein
MYRKKPRALLMNRWDCCGGESMRQPSRASNRKQPKAAHITHKRLQIINLMPICASNSPLRNRIGFDNMNGTRIRFRDLPLDIIIETTHRGKTVFAAPFLVQHHKLPLSCRLHRPRSTHVNKSLTKNIHLRSRVVERRSNRHRSLFYT